MLLEKISFLNLLSHNTIKIAKHFKGSNIKLILSKASHSKNLNKDEGLNIENRSDISDSDDIGVKRMKKRIENNDTEYCGEREKNKLFV